MQFGVQFFPDVAPEQKSGAEYFAEALILAEQAERVGFTHIRIVEHYFHRYGGYSSNPMLFLAAASQRTRRARLVTGAVLPVFNHPLKLAGEIGMLDAISGGRLDVGFGRAFLPHEFRRFGRSAEESIARFREGIEQVELSADPRERDPPGSFSLDREHDIAAAPHAKAASQIPRRGAEHGRFFRFCRPHGVFGHGDPAGRGRDAAVARRLSRRLEGRRAPWRGRGYAGVPHVLRCRWRSRPGLRLPVHRRLSPLVEAASDWLDRRTSQDYPGYDRVIAKLRQSRAADQIGSGAAWIGSAEEIVDQIRRTRDAFGRYEHASLQVNFNMVPLHDALASMRLFAEQVMPHFTRTE
jgi:alkanesulfonate monooxygenase SsuD/methylene tetrahydromethanopterin reductase-like flavin-dependent oxidoreductase (luciferase family)